MDETFEFVKYSAKSRWMVFRKLEGKIVSNMTLYFPVDWPIEVVKQNFETMMRFAHNNDDWRLK